MTKTISTKLASGFLSIIFAATTFSTAIAAPKIVSLTLNSEPPQLNSMRATDQASIMILGHVMEGLTSTGKNGEIIPGVAEKWEVKADKATFKLRKNAKWSDGKPVTAKDFIFAWRNALDPKTASEYAFIFYPIKNAEAINQGKLPTKDLGVVAPDDYSLEVTFEKPCGYFAALTAFAVYSPVREDFFNTRKEKYAADAVDMLYNGPFVLKSWVHGASLEMVKNPQYWNASSIKIDGINVPYITPDNTAAFNFFKDKKTDFVEIGKDELPLAQAEKYKLSSFADGSVWYMDFNHREGRVTRNKSLRKAIQLVFNSQEFVSKVVAIPGTKPGKTLIPSYMRGVKDTFRKEYPYNPPKTNLAEAKKLIEQAKKELGVTQIPPLVWLTQDTPLAGREAEYFQNQLKTKLGLDVKIDRQIFKQRLAKMTSGEFDIVSAGWGPDYADPMTFADLFTSWNENNRGRYRNAEVDKHIREAQATADPRKRMDSMAAAEKILLDEVAILPTYERVKMYSTSPRLQGLVRHAVGLDTDFRFATIKE